MMLSSLFGAFLRSRISKSACTAAVHKSRRQRLLRVEPLEERRVLAVTPFVSHPTSNSTEFISFATGLGAAIDASVNFDTHPTGPLNGSFYSGIGVTLSATGDVNTIVNNAGPNQGNAFSPPISPGEGPHASSPHIFDGGEPSSLTISFASPVIGVGLTTVDYFNPSGTNPLTIQAFTGPNGTGSLLGSFSSAAFNFQPNSKYFMGVVSDLGDIRSIVFTDVNNNTGDTIGLDDVLFAVKINSPPTAEANGPYTVAEGGTLGLSGSGSDPDGDPISFEWDLDGNSVFGEVAGARGNETLQNPSFSAEGLDGPSTFTVSLRTRDSHGAVSVVDTATIHVGNVGPTLSDLSATPILENGTTTLSGTIADVGTLDTFTIEIDWDNDGIYEELHTNVAAGAFNYPHQYLDDNPTGSPVDNVPINVKVTDDDAGSVTGSTTVEVTNVAPEIVSLSLSSVSIEEGSSTTLTVHWSDPGTQDTYTVSIDWGDGTIDVLTEPASASGSATRTYTHTYRDDGGTVFVDSMSPLGWLNMTPGNGTASDVYALSVTVTDDDTGSDSDGTSVTVNNVDPTLSAIQGVPLTDDPDECNTTWVVSGAFSDPGTDTYQFVINWGDGTTSLFNVPGFDDLDPLTPDSTPLPAPGPYGSFGLVANNFFGSASHTYASFGTFTITVSVVDDDGGAVASALVGVVAVEATAEVVSDPAWGTVLEIHGTDFDDYITVNQTIENGALVYKVHANSWATDRTYPAAGVNAIRIHLCDGDDVATISSGVDIGSIIFGEAGNDQLNGGKRASIVIGGDGDDTLLGGNGNDILIGGRGADRIVGNASDDILIAGYTSYDATDTALKALLTVWNGSKNYATRVAAVQSLSATYHLITAGALQTVFSDTAVDRLTGSAGSDLFFANLIADTGDDAVLDIITDLKCDKALDIDAFWSVHPGDSTPLEGRLWSPFYFTRRVFKSCAPDG